MLCVCSVGFHLSPQCYLSTKQLQDIGYTSPTYLAIALFLGSTACCDLMHQLLQSTAFASPPTTLPPDTGLSWTGSFLRSAARLWSLLRVVSLLIPSQPPPLFEPSRSYLSWNLCSLFLFRVHFIGGWVWLDQPIPLSLSFCLDASWSFCFQNPKTPSLMMLFCLPAFSRKSEPNSECIQHTVGKASTLCNRKNKCEVCIFSSAFASSILPVKYLSSPVLTSGRTLRKMPVSAKTTN